MNYVVFLILLFATSITSTEGATKALGRIYINNIPLSLLDPNLSHSTLNALPILKKMSEEHLQKNDPPKRIVYKESPEEIAYKEKLEQIKKQLEEAEVKLKAEKGINQPKYKIDTPKEQFHLDCTPSQGQQNVKQLAEFPQLAGIEKQTLDKFLEYVSIPEANLDTQLIKDFEKASREEHSGKYSAITSVEALRLRNIAIHKLDELIAINGEKVNVLRKLRELIQDYFSHSETHTTGCPLIGLLAKINK